MFKDNGEVIHFANPKVQASLGSNTFAISGPSDTKCKTTLFFFHRWNFLVCLALQDMLPTIMSQMGMSTESGFTGKQGDQQTGDGHSGTTNEQAGAEGDDEVPGMSIKILSNSFLYLFISS